MYCCFNRKKPFLMWCVGKGCQDLEPDDFGIKSHFHCFPVSASLYSLYFLTNTMRTGIVLRGFQIFYGALAVILDVYSFSESPGIFYLFEGLKAYLLLLCLCTLVIYNFFLFLKKLACLEGRWTHRDGERGKVLQAPVCWFTLLMSEMVLG